MNVSTTSNHWTVEPAAVLVVVPTLNERPHVRRVIQELLVEDENHEMRLVVVDGGSSDGTINEVQEVAASDHRVSLLHNPDRTQAAGVNLAVRLASPDVSFVVRADCHARYPAGWVRQVVNTLAARRGENCASVVVSMITVGITPIQRGIAYAQNSLLGNGGSSHRRRTESRYVDHGHHAAFARYEFSEAGGYREDLVANEDAELDLRLVTSGKRIFLDSSAAIEYYPRDSFRALIRQYVKYGHGRAQTHIMHRKGLKVRQAMPIAISTYTATLAVLILVGDKTHWFAALPWLFYVAACVGLGIRGAFSGRDAALVLSGPAAFLMHHAWGWGFLRKFFSWLAGQMAARLLIVGGSRARTIAERDR